MNKLEKVEMETLRVRCALAWPSPPKKPVDLDVARRTAATNWVRLWSFNAHGRRVHQGVTNGHLHSNQPLSDEQLDDMHGRGLSLSRGAGGPWFLTEKEAFQALHHAVAVECAQTLRDIEKRSAAAQERAQQQARRAVSLKIQTYDKNTARIVEEGQVVALIQTLAIGRFSLCDPDDRRLVNSSYRTRAEALDAFAELRKAQPHD